MNLSLDHKLPNVIGYRIDNPRLEQFTFEAINYIESLIDVDFQWCGENPNLTFYTNPNVDYLGLTERVEKGVKYNIHMQFWADKTTAIHEITHALGIWKHHEGIYDMDRTIMGHGNYYQLAAWQAHGKWGNIDIVKMNMAYGMAKNYTGKLWGTPWDDFNLQGNANDNEISGGDGSDAIFGFGGNDTLIGGNRTTDTGDTSDVIHGGGGDDLIIGNAGYDNLFGGYGDDTLKGGLGDDFMVGGAGADTFYVYGNDNVIDFNPLEGDRMFMVETGEWV